VETFQGVSRGFHPLPVDCPALQGFRGGKWKPLFAPFGWPEIATFPPRPGSPLRKDPIAPGSSLVQATAISSRSNLTPPMQYFDRYPREADRERMASRRAVLPA
jgi:hypothetical protein